MSGPVPALSITQPWAELILSGQKTIELRTWVTTYRGRLWLHTGQRRDRSLEEAFGIRKPLFRGGFIGSIELSAVVPMDESRWVSWQTRHLDSSTYRPGFYAWLVGAPRRLVAPIRAPGALGLFTPTPEMQDRLWQATVPE